jgi:hypothetical protein
VLLFAKGELIISRRQDRVLGHGLFKRAVTVTGGELGAFGSSLPALLDIGEEGEIDRLLAGRERERRKPE